MDASRPFACRRPCVRKRCPVRTGHLFARPPFRLARRNFTSDGRVNVMVADGGVGCWVRSVEQWRSLVCRAVEDNCSTMLACEARSSYTIAIVLKSILANQFEPLPG